MTNPALFIAILTLTASCAWAGDTQPPAPQFFEQHCFRCHGEDKQKADFRLDTLSRDFSVQIVAERWAEVMFRLNNGEMPPRKERQPKPEELGAAVDWIAARLRESEAGRMARRGPVAHYRLSKEEYGYTVEDLLGVYFDVNYPGAFNEDPRWHGFERIGSMLTLSPSHVERYIKAADTVLERAFPATPAKVKKDRRDANAGNEKWLADHKLAGPVRWMVFQGLHRPLINITETGKYRIRIQLSGLGPPGGRAPHLSIWDRVTKESIFDRDIIAAEDKPIVVEVEMPMSVGMYDIANEVPGFNENGNHTLNILSGGGSVFTSSKEVRYLNPTGYQLFDEDGKAIYPILLVDWVEREGPLTSDQDAKKREGLIPPSSGGLAEARECLKRFAERAWRRPASDAELDRFLNVVSEELAAGEKFPSAYRAAMIAILASKNFYYLEEGSPTEQREKMNDWELASRLSYFLWSSMPDGELFAAARAGTLHEPAILKAQVQRMLADPKIGRFTESFPRQWLQLDRVGMFAPDQKLYPEYDKWLEKSMVLETTGYFGEMFARNLSLKDFLVSDWTMCNPRLALHYGIGPLKESGMQRVALRPQDHRGGLLTQASILSLTSDGTRHRPVHRGVWVSEAIFGRTPPPPPPNVEPLMPTPGNKPKMTVRMQLEAHSTNAVCASCHRKIDPLGVAFDNYDAIGQWRDEERVTAGQGKNPKVNADGVLPDGRAYSGPEEFKELLVQDLDRFAEAFTGELATYGLRRAMTIDDYARIKAIAQASRRDGYPLREVIENLVVPHDFGINDHCN